MCRPLFKNYLWLASDVHFGLFITSWNQLIFQLNHFLQRPCLHRCFLTDKWEDKVDRQTDLLFGWLSSGMHVRQVIYLLDFSFINLIQTLEMCFCKPIIRIRRSSFFCTKSKHHAIFVKHGWLRFSKSFFLADCQGWALGAHVLLVFLLFFFR